MEFGAIIGAQEHGLPPLDDDTIVEEVGCAPAVERRNRGGFYPLGKRVNGYEEVAVPISISGKWACCVNAPSAERGLALVDPA